LISNRILPGSGKTAVLRRNAPFNIRAAVEDSTVTAGSVDISANGSPVIDALTIAGAAGVTTSGSLAFGGAGAGSGNEITSTIEAVIQDSSVTTTSGDLSLTATDGSVINADAGAGAVAVAVGGDSAQAGIAVGAAAATNEIQTTARAAILDSTVKVDGAAELEARSTAVIDAFTLGIAGALTAGGSGTGASIGGAGSGSGNSVTNTIEAKVKGSSLTTGGNVRLEAEDG